MVLPLLTILIWRPGAWPVYVDAVVEAVRQIGLTVSTGLVFVGIVGVTALDPRLTLTEQPIVLRRLVRGSALTTLAAMAADNLLAYASFVPASFTAVADVVVLWTKITLLVLTAMVFSLYLARLAERVPDRSLAGKTALTAKRFAVVVVMVLAAKLIATAAGYRSLFALSRSESGTWALLGIVASLCGLFAYIYSVALMVRWWSFRKVLKRCLLEARAREDHTQAGRL
jgi:hypothetical protein